MAIVRVSGPDALVLADRIFEGPGAKPSERPARTFVYGTVTVAGERIDEALCLIFHAPHSYTGETVVELQGHGGGVCGRRILRAVLDAGARPAEPGEFTRRAFLNGRIDLVQAEAVMDLITAHSERASAAALEQLDGALSKVFDERYDRLASIAADLEATLDFPEDELPDTILPRIVGQMRDEDTALAAVIATWEEGHLLRDGAVVVLSGRPNTGKSTLLNALLGNERAIVSDVEGTTRDHIEEAMVLGGVPVRLVDTAGLRATGDAIEQAGIERTHQWRSQADLHVYLVDRSVALSDEVRTHIAELPTERSVLIWNKSDLPTVADAEEWRERGYRVVDTSLASGEGLAELRELMTNALLQDVAMSARPHAVIGERHRHLLVSAREELASAIDYMASDQPEYHVLAVSQLRLAIERVGEATGRDYEEDLLDRIFSRFCIGK